MTADLGPVLEAGTPGAADCRHVGGELRGVGASGAGAPETLTHTQVLPPVLCAPQGVRVRGADHRALGDLPRAVDVDGVVWVECVSGVWSVTEHRSGRKIRRKGKRIKRK